MRDTHPHPEKLDWSDPDAVRAWARDILTQARDAIGAGEDATRPPGRRELGRRAARRIIAEADRAIGALGGFAGLTSEKAPARKRGSR